MPYRLLVVDPDAQSRAAVERALTGAGNLVSCLSTFEDAKQRLLLARPDLLVVALRLGSYNGIQLVLRAHDDTPAMPAVVLHHKYDPVLEMEARNADATYLVMTKPFDGRPLVALVERLLTDAHVRTTPLVPRRWRRKQTSVTARVGRSDAKIVDVSYRGLRLEMSGVPLECLSHLATIYIPHLGKVAVHPVWASGDTTTSALWWCGAEVSANDEHRPEWRNFVDSLN
jgi:DNA-binding response OmpR family regulator